MFNNNDICWSQWYYLFVKGLVSKSCYDTFIMYIMFFYYLINFCRSRDMSYTLRPGIYIYISLSQTCQLPAMCWDDARLPIPLQWSFQVLLIKESLMFGNGSNKKRKLYHIDSTLIWNWSHEETNMSLCPHHWKSYFPLCIDPHFKFVQEKW